MTFSLPCLLGFHPKWGTITEGVGGPPRAIVCLACGRTVNLVLPAPEAPKKKPIEPVPPAPRPLAPPRV